MARTAWAGSNRATRLPKNWATIRQQVRRRAQGRCEAIQHHPACDGTGTECDHITPGDNHDIDNLMWLNAHCHKDKTRSETIARNQANAALRKRPQEQHPGKISNTQAT